MKKTLFVLIAFICFGVNAFAQSEYKVKFRNEKLAIFEYFQPAKYGDLWINSQMLNFVNRTNFEMEVKCSFTIRIVAVDSRGKDRTIVKKGEIIKLKPNSDILIQGFDYATLNGLHETSFIYFDELINYRVLEKDYEIK